MTKANYNEGQLKVLQGAKRALGIHGLAKLAMSDVCREAKISRATLYRYFDTKEDLLRALSEWEQQNFVTSLTEALSQAAPEKRFEILMAHSASLATDHPALQRLLESDPGYVLTSLRERFSMIRDQLSVLLKPIIADTWPVSEHHVKVEQLVDCFCRLLITSYLFPDSKPGSMEKTLTTMYQLISSPSPD